MKQLVYTSVFVCIFGVFLLRGWLFDSYYFSQGQYYYDAGVYSGAISEFEQISDRSVSLHNIGNTFFQEYISSREGNVDLLWLALWAYSGSLSLEENQDTRDNYEKALAYLSKDEASETQQESQAEEQEVDSSGPQEKESEEEETQAWQDTVEEDNNSETSQGILETSSWSQDSGEQDSDTTQQQDTSELSSSQTQELENYIQSLQREQLQNQQFYGKQSFQRDTLLQQRFWGWERDW